MDIREFLKENIVVLDGGMGTLLQKAGLRPGEEPELWNLTHACEVESIQRAYFDAGSNVVNTNTFGANNLHFEREMLEEIIKSALEIAKKARESSCGAQPKFIALDIGPTGKLLKPLGDLDFEEAVSVFSETVRIGAKEGVEIIAEGRLPDAQANCHQNGVAGLLNSATEIQRTVTHQLVAMDLDAVDGIDTRALEGIRGFHHALLQRHGGRNDLEGRAGDISLVERLVGPTGKQQLTFERLIFFTSRGQP